MHHRPGSRIMTTRTACSCGGGIIVQHFSYTPGCSWGPWENATEDVWDELDPESCEACGNADPDHIVEDDSCAS